MPSKPVRLRYQIIIITLVRAVINTAVRMVYPFLPFIARGVGVELSALTRIITLRAGVGIFGPVLGAAGDTLGRRTGMVIGSVLFGGSLLLVILWPTYPALAAALILSFLGKVIFDPSAHALLGDRVPYSRRGLAIAIFELSWSAAYLLGIPVLGWLIARLGWVSPFPLLGVLGLLGGVVIWRTLPGNETQPVDRPSLLEGFRTVLDHPAALAGLTFGMLISASNETISIIYGAWMEQSFGLQVAALGLATAVLGGAELAGEGLVAGLVDRLGKRRSIAAGVALNIAASIGLPFMGELGLTGALIGLFLFYITFEFTLVGSIPIMTELVPGARATLLSANISGLAAGRMLGSALGPVLFRMGMLANGIGAALINAAALVILLLFVRVE